MHSLEAMPKRVLGGGAGAASARAERLGFLQPGAYVAVPRLLKERAKAVVRSIVVHVEHNSLKATTKPTFWVSGNKSHRGDLIE